MSLSKMLTSTPTKRTRNPIPLQFDDEDASTIGSETFICGPEGAESETYSTDHAGLGISEYKLFLQQHKLPKIGVWIQKNFPPSQNDSIYGKFCKNITDGETVANSILNDYIFNNRKKALIELLQFCLDVSNVKSFTLSKYYNFETNNAEEIIKKIDANDQIISVQYLLEKLVNQNVYIKMSIFHFLNRLIHNAYEKGILQDDFFFNHLFQFLRCMSLSEYLCLRHTSVAFVTVILTTIVEIVRKQPTEQLNNMITLLFPIFTINYFITDNKLIGLRYDCKKIIRLLVLNKCGKLLNHLPIRHYLNKHIDMLLKSITERFIDVEDDVVLKALNLFNFLSDIYSDKCVEMKQNIIHVLYYQDNNLAQLAAGCLLKLHKMQKTSDWCNLVAISLYFKNELKCGLLVNSFLTLYDDITNWKLYINMFLTCENVNVALENLSYIFFEAVHQVLLQKPSIFLNIKRVMQFPEPDESHNERFAFNFIPNVVKLIEKFSKNNTILKNILKLLNIINYKELTNNYQENYLEILMNLLELYKNVEENTVLEVLSTTFHIFNTNISTIEDNINELVVCLCENNQISHVMHLFRHFNLIDSPLNIQNDAENSLVGLECRKLFIIWSVRTCINELNSNGITSIDLCDILNKYETLITHLLELLKNETNSTNAKTIFLHLVELLIIFQNEIKDHATLESRLNDFRFEIESSSENEDIIIKFYEKFVIPKSSDLQLYIRENLFLKIMFLFASKSIKHTVIVHILRYFNSHYNIFGKVYEQMIEILKPAFTTYVFMGFKAIYLEIIDKYHSFNNDLRETKELNLLATKFAQNSYFKTSSEHSSTLVLLILYYVFKDGADVDFLYLARYFIKHLSMEGALKLRTYFNAEVDSVETHRVYQDLLKAFNEKLNENQ